MHRKNRERELRPDAGCCGQRLERFPVQLVFGLREELADAGIAAQINAIGSLATIFFTSEPVRNYTDAKRSDTKRYARFFREMLDRGKFLAPSQFECAFVSLSHTDELIERTIAAARSAMLA